MTASAFRERTCDPIKMHAWIFLCLRFICSSPASVFGKTHGVLLVQVKVSGKLPQVRFALGRLVDLKKQVDGVLPVSICRKETDTLRISFLDTEMLFFCLLVNRQLFIMRIMINFTVLFTLPSE